MSLRNKILAVDGSEQRCGHADSTSFPTAKYLIAPKILSQAPIISVNLILLNKYGKNTNFGVNLFLHSRKALTSLAPGTPCGGVQNNSPYFIKEVKLTFLLYGAGGKLSGRAKEASSTARKARLQANLVGNFREECGSAEASAETNLLDKTNLAIPETNNPAGRGFGKVKIA